uniref:Uncharacterized protein n=1 Tax=Opuntia streptacantha TaxID=393608 RepID=A0A7C9E2V9_OPUST
MDGLNKTIRLRQMIMILGRGGAAFPNFLHSQQSSHCVPKYAFSYTYLFCCFILPYMEKSNLIFFFFLFFSFSVVTNAAVGLCRKHLVDGGFQLFDQLRYHVGCKEGLLHHFLYVGQPQQSPCSLVILLQNLCQPNVINVAVVD